MYIGFLRYVPVLPFMGFTRPALSYPILSCPVSSFLFDSFAFLGCHVVWRRGRVYQSIHAMPCRLLSYVNVCSLAPHPTTPPAFPHYSLTLVPMAIISSSTSSRHHASLRKNPCFSFSLFLSFSSLPNNSPALFRRFSSRLPNPKDPNPRSPNAPKPAPLGDSPVNQPCSQNSSSRSRSRVLV